jgi:methionyl-tRNA synthetase
MKDKILVCVAWPYANGDLHLGHLAGCYLSADIFARYHRLRGNEVLMVSGSDTHGTPITLTAEQEGLPPIKIVERFHARFLETFIGLGITFDYFTHTETENHIAVTQDIFRRLLANGHIYRETTQGLYCPHCERFLPDRYVEGTCPFCGYEQSRGDQCDRCGKPINALELLEPRCRFCGQAPEVRETEHFFHDLAHFNEPLRKWIQTKDYWRPNVLNLTRGFLNEGLRGRAISRDIDWGIPVPVPGYEDKRIYVWFDAVIGYFAATVEWAKEAGQPEAWHDWWDEDAPCRSYYFIGKDNIFFHTLSWPATLMSLGDLMLPYDVPANEFLTLEGDKLSTSRNWAVWLPDYLERYDPDPLRYMLSIHMPETSDLDFTWSEFLQRNNAELVATYGNLAHRVLTFAYRRFDRCVPQPGSLDEADREILSQAEAAFEPVAELLEACKFKAAISQIMALAHEANRYLDTAAPWLHIRDNPERAATGTYVALRVIDSLKTLLYPFLPFSSQALHTMLGYEDNLFGDQYVESHDETEGSHTVLHYRSPLSGDMWIPSQLPPGQRLKEPKALFVKLDEDIVEQEIARMRGAP